MDGNGKLAATQSLAQVAGPGLGALLVGLLGRGAGHGQRRAVVRGLGRLPAGHPEPGAGRTAGTRRRAAGAASASRSATGCATFCASRSCATPWPGTARPTSSSIMVETLGPVFLIRTMHLRPAYVGVLLALGAVGGVAAGLAARPLIAPDRLGPAELAVDDGVRAARPADPAGPAGLVGRCCSRWAGSPGRSAPRCAASRWSATSRRPARQSCAAGSARPSAGSTGARCRWAAWPAGRSGTVHRRARHLVAGGDRRLLIGPVAVPVPAARPARPGHGPAARADGPLGSRWPVRDPCASFRPWSGAA